MSYDLFISSITNCINLLNDISFRSMKTKNYYYQLAMTISQLQQQGKIVTIKQLPSTVNRRREIITMNYAKETKSSLIDILKYRDNEIKEFQSLYAHGDINFRELKEKQQVLIYLLIVTFTIGVLF